MIRCACRERSVSQDSKIAHNASLLECIRRRSSSKVGRPFHLIFRGRLQIDIPYSARSNEETNCLPFAQSRGYVQDQSGAATSECRQESSVIQGQTVLNFFVLLDRSEISALPPWCLRRQLPFHQDQAQATVTNHRSTGNIEKTDLDRTSRSKHTLPHLSASPLHHRIST